MFPNCMYADQKPPLQAYLQYKKSLSNIIHLSHRQIPVLYNLSLHLIHCLPLSKWSSCRISPPILIGTRRYMYLLQRAMSQRRRISIYCKKESYRLLCESNRCIIISKKGDVQNENHQYQIRGFNLRRTGCDA